MIELTPGTDAHAKVVKYLKDRLERSERAMGDFYPRWRVNEQKLQAYIHLKDYERLLEAQNKKGFAPRVVSLIMPYSYAVTQTIITYLIHTFCGRQPIFQVSSNNGNKANQARKLEQMLQYNADHTKLILQIFMMLQNAEVYQFGAVRVNWSEEYRFRTQMGQVTTYSMFGEPIGQAGIPQRVRELTYSGNEVESIDPFLFFPDPSVPMTRVSRDGEYVFWRKYKSMMWLKQRAAQGIFRHLDRIPSSMPNNYGSSESNRALRSQGEGIAGTREDTENTGTVRMVQIDEGTVDVIPAELGLSEATYPERWLFTMANKETIIRAEPLEADHGLHPVAVIEPNAMGEAFGSISTVDVVGPVQDHISWLINSHMQNVRGAINNRLVVNPHYVHMEDLRKDPTEDDGAWILRMKQSAFGMKPADGIFQLAVQDVTSGNLKSVDLMIRMGHMFAGVNDNLMGLQDSSGRKTATEVRTAGEAGASRLAAKARLISAQGLSDLPMMMGVNLQQRLDPAFYSRVLGPDMDGSAFIQTPGDVAGDFNYPINDGTLPLDRALLLSVWKEIMLAVAQDPELRANYSLPKLFAYVADLGGARNIDTFKIQPMQDQMVQQQAQAGNIVPMSAIAGGMNG